MNQVERSPSAARSSPPPTMLCPVGSVSVAVTTRPDGPGTGARSSTVPFRPSAFAAFAPSTAAVQVTYGDASYGSSTDARYGTARPPGNASLCAAVRPPELDEKSALIGLPCQVTTCP